MITTTTNHVRSHKKGFIFKKESKKNSTFFHTSKPQPLLSIFHTPDDEL